MSVAMVAGLGVTILLTFVGTFFFVRVVFSPYLRVTTVEQAIASKEYHHRQEKLAIITGILWSSSFMTTIILACIYSAGKHGW